MASQTTIWYTNALYYSTPENVGFYGGAAAPVALNPIPWTSGNRDMHSPYSAAPGPPLFVHYTSDGISMQHMQQMGLGYGPAAYPTAFPIQNTFDPRPAAASGGALDLSTFPGAETGLQVGGAGASYYQQQTHAQLALPSYNWAVRLPSGSGLVYSKAQAPAPRAAARGAKPPVQSRPLPVKRVPTRLRASDPGVAISSPVLPSRVRAAPFDKWEDAPSPPSKRSRPAQVGAGAGAAPQKPEPGSSFPGTRGDGMVESSARGRAPLSLESEGAVMDLVSPAGSPKARGRGLTGIATVPGNARRLASRVAGATESYMRFLDYRTFESVLSLGCDIAWALFPDPRTVEGEPITVVLVDSEGREWPCKYHTLVGKHSYVLRSGWRKLVQEKGIAKNDIVVLSKASQATNPDGLPCVRIDIVPKKAAARNPGLASSVPPSPSTIPEGTEDISNLEASSIAMGIASAAGAADDALVGRTALAAGATAQAELEAADAAPRA